MNVDELNTFMNNELETMKSCIHPIDRVYCIRVSPDGTGYYRCEICSRVIKKDLTPIYEW